IPAPCGACGAGATCFAGSLRVGTLIRLESSESPEATGKHRETEQRRHHGEDACDQRPAKPAASDQHESRANTNWGTRGFVLARDSCGSPPALRAGRTRRPLLRFVSVSSCLRVKPFPPRSLRLLGNSPTSLGFSR